MWEQLGKELITRQLDAEKVLIFFVGEDGNDRVMFTSFDEAIQALYTGTCRRDLGALGANDWSDACRVRVEVTS